MSCWARIPAAAVRSPSSIPFMDRLSRGWALAGHGSDGGRGLAQRLVDRLDDLLAGLVGPRRLHHVDHRLGRIGARVLERGGADRAGNLARDDARRAGDVVVALLLGVAQKHDVELAWIDGAVGADLDRPVVAAEHVIAGERDQLALVVGVELAVARVARALARLDGEEAVAGDAEVERLAGVLERLGRPVGDRAGDLHGRRLVTDGLARHRVLEQELTERLLRGAVGLVAGRGSVGEVVGDLVLASLLGEHAGGCEIKAAIHVALPIGGSGIILEVMEPIAVLSATLRAQLPDVPLREGTTMMARVAARGE